MQNAVTRQMDVPVLPLAEQRRIVAELDALQAEVDALKRLQAKTAAELDALLPALLQPSPGFDPTRDRAWTHSHPARSGCALSLNEILLARSQLTRIKGEL